MGTCRGKARGFRVRFMCLHSAAVRCMEVLSCCEEYKPTHSSVVSSSGSGIRIDDVVQATSEATSL